MKKLIALSVIALSGCSYFVKYDTGEYTLLNEIATIAQVSKDCDKIAIQGLHFKMAELTNYSAGLPNNTAVVEMNGHLAVMINEYYDRYNSGKPMSELYCNTKFNVIHGTAQAIQKTAGSKIR